jgi:hypothetical protein
MTHLQLSKLLAGVASLAALTLAAPAHAADRGEDESDADAQALGTHQRHLRLDIGARTQYVSSAGLDPFSENDAIPQLSLGASYAFWARDQLSIAAVAGFDYSDWSARARSADASLDLRRFTLGAEARYHLLRVLVLTAKLAPTLTRESALLSTEIGSDLKSTAWKGGFDATAGAAVELFGYHSGTSRKPRLWLTAEGGYGWTASNPMVLQPEEPSEAPERTQALDLQDLSLSGPLFKISAALSFW